MRATPDGFALASSARIAIVLGVFSVVDVKAASGDAITIGVAQDFVYEDNVFRVADDAHPIVDGRVRPRADTLSATTLSGNFDRLYSRQRLMAQVAISRKDYLEFSHLDFTARNARAGWQWVLGNQWSGVIAADQSESLRSFADRAGTVRSINTYRRYVADAHYQLHPQWSVGAGWARVDSRFDDDRSAGAEYVEDALEASGTYRSPAGSTLAMVMREADGRYPGRVAGSMSVSSYEQRDLLLRANWAVGGHSRISGQAGYTWRDYPHLGNRNFSGFTGRMTYDWSPTGKLGLGVTVRREMGAREDVADNFVVTRAVSLNPVWHLSEKLAVRGRIERLARDYGGSPFPVVAPGRDDKTRVASVSIEWRPVRELAFTLGALREQRSGSAAAVGYSVESMFVGAKYSF